MKSAVEIKILIFNYNYIHLKFDFISISILEINIIMQAILVEAIFQAEICELRILYLN